MTMLQRLIRDERGASLMFTAIAMLTVLAMAAVAIDAGMLYTAKGQAQNAADSGALAGAGSLLQSPDDAATATTVAKDFAEKHEIINQQVQIVTAEDVQV